MTTTRLSALSLLVSLCCLSLGAPAEAADFTGAWTTDASVCNKVFVKNGGRISFAKDSELVGGGLIFQGKEIQGTGATCRIKTTKEDGEVTHMVLACATGSNLETDLGQAANLCLASSLSAFPVDRYACDLM